MTLDGEKFFPGHEHLCLHVESRASSKRVLAQDWCQAPLRRRRGVISYQVVQEIPERSNPEIRQADEDSRSGTLSGAHIDRRCAKCFRTRPSTRKLSRFRARREFRSMIR